MVSFVSLRMSEVCSCVSFNVARGGLVSNIFL